MVLLFWLMVAATLMGVALALAMLWRERPGGVIVLLYHRLLRTGAEHDAQSGSERHFSLPVERFREQMEHLAAAGYAFVDLQTLYDYVVEGRDLPQPGRVVCLTFDDGATSIDELALPVLRAHAAPAAVFVTTDSDAWVFEEQPRLSDAALRRLAESGLTLGSHGVSHQGLDRMSPEERDVELTESRRRLGELAGVRVCDLALPLNFYDRPTLRACREAGYRLVFTSNPGTVRQGDRTDRLRRVAVEGTMSLDRFRASLRPTALVQRRVINALKRLPPKLLGAARWMPLRERIFRSWIGRYLGFGHLRRGLLVATVCWFALLTAVALW